MNIELFQQTYNKSRNGANEFFRHPLARRVIYSDGVHDCAEAGIYWLVDIAATELPRHLYADGTLGVLRVSVKHSKAHMALETDDDTPPVWKKVVTYTDLPDGVWTFFLTNDGKQVTMILPSEY